MTARSVVAVFARAPELGRVKTRLAAGVGDRAALSAYERLTTSTLRGLAGIGTAATELWVAGQPSHPGVQRWLHEHPMPVRQQRGADVGERMSNAMQQLLLRYEHAVIVGVDCVGIDAEYVRGALEALTDHDVVIGPAEDGGYGLIGLKRHDATLFQHIDWGTSTVCKQTLAAVRNRGLSCRLLAQIWDVDHPDDWRRYQALFDP